MLKSMLIHPDDNVAVALDEIPSGAPVTLLGLPGDIQISAQGAIAFAHKIAVRPIAAGEPILKYGVPIAVATAGISVGEWVHTHNATTLLVSKNGEQKL